MLTDELAHQLCETTSSNTRPSMSFISFAIPLHIHPLLLRSFSIVIEAVCLFVGCTKISQSSWMRGIRSEVLHRQESLFSSRSRSELPIRSFRLDLPVVPPHHTCVPLCLFAGSSCERRTLTDSLTLPFQCPEPGPLSSGRNLEKPCSTSYDYALSTRWTGRDAAVNFAFLVLDSPVLLCCIQNKRFPSLSL